MSLLEGVIQRFTRKQGGDSPLRLTEFQSLAVAQVEPPGFELARAGRMFWGGGQQGATGRAPVTAVPTTGAAFLLWNGEPDGGRAIVPVNITLTQVSGTAAIGGAILAALTTTKVAAPTAATGYASASASGRGSTKAVWADNQTLGATPTWVALVGHGNPATTTEGGITVQLPGGIVVPPGFGLALNHISGTGTTPLLTAFAVWAEIDAYLE